MKKTKSRGNGEGTIYERTIRGKKQWVAQYTLGFNDNGKRKSKTIYGKTRKEVKEKLDILISELKTDKYVDKNTTIFKDLALEFIEDGYKLNKLSDVSFRRKKDTYLLICSHYMANMEIQKITERDVKEFLYHITTYSNSVIGKVYGIVNNTFKRAVHRNIIKYNFLDDKLDCPKPKSIRKDKKVRGFDIHEHRLFLDMIKENDIKYKHQILLSLCTGMRMRRD